MADSDKKKEQRGEQAPMFDEDGKPLSKNEAKRRLKAAKKAKQAAEKAAKKAAAAAAGGGGASVSMLAEAPGRVSLPMPSSAVAVKSAPLCASSQARRWACAFGRLRVGPAETSRTQDLRHGAASPAGGSHAQACWMK